MLQKHFFASGEFAFSMVIKVRFPLMFILASILFLKVLRGMDTRGSWRLGTRKMGRGGQWMQIIFKENLRHILSGKG